MFNTQMNKMATSHAVQTWASAELHLVVLTHFPLTARRQEERRDRRGREANGGWAYCFHLKLKKKKKYRSEKFSRHPLKQSVSDE